MTTPMTPDKNQTDVLSLADDIENFEEVLLHTLDGDWSDARRLTAEEQDMVVAALRSSTATGGREELELRIQHAMAHVAEDRPSDGTVKFFAPYAKGVADAILSLPPIGSGAEAMRERLYHLSQIASAFLAHFNPTQLAEDASQQWQALHHEIEIATAALSSLPVPARQEDPLFLVQDGVQTKCEQPVLSGNDGSEAKSEWRDIETLPEDGSKFDALCVRHDGSRLPVRFTDVSMRGDGSGFGFIQHTKTGPVWHYLEEEDEVFPAWKIWKWMPQPDAPASLTEGDVA